MSTRTGYPWFSCLALQQRSRLIANALETACPHAAFQAIRIFHPPSRQHPFRYWNLLPTIDALCASIVATKNHQTRQHVVDLSMPRAARRLGHLGYRVANGEGVRR